MFIQWQTLGHNLVKNILQKQLVSRKFPHAYLFIGPSQIGKKTLALEFSGKLLNTNAEKLLIHPDFLFLDLSQAEVKKEMARSVREFIASSSLKPQISEFKIAIIDGAEDLNEEGSNALLKTLEEPLGKTIIFLISSVRNLLPTIISRCQASFFTPLTEKQMLAFTESLDFKASGKEFLQASGKPAKLLALTQGEKTVKQEQEILEKFEEFISAPLENRLLAIKSLSQTEGVIIKEVLESRLILESRNIQGDLKNKLAILSALGSAWAELATNKNLKFILQGLSLKLP